MKEIKFVLKIGGEEVAIDIYTVEISKFKTEITRCFELFKLKYINLISDIRYSIYYQIESKANDLF